MYDIYGLPFTINKNPSQMLASIYHIYMDPSWVSWCALLINIQTCYHIVIPLISNEQKCVLLLIKKKLFLFSRYLNICLDFLVMQKNGLIRKIMIISTFMTSQPGKQTIPTHILPNISRSNGS